MLSNTQRAAALALLATPFLLAHPASAQEAQETEATDTPACEATVSPAAVSASETPVQVRIALSEEIGHFEFQAPEESGLLVVTPEDVPMSEMAAEEGETPEPVAMADEDDGAVVIWLNTTNAAVGSYEILLNGEAGTCSAMIGVEATPSN
jgi:hypothetical protein